jgi:putative redox protein
METSRIRFPGARGEQLAGWVEQSAEGGGRGWALFAHCFTCSGSSRAAVDVSRGLARAGFGVLRFDFTGLGKSDGEFSDTGFSSNVGDLLAAARVLEQRFGPPDLLVGHSLGGAAVLHAARSLPSVSAVATVGAPADPSHVLRHMEGSLERIREEGQAKVRIGGRSFRIRQSFVEDLEETRMEETVSNLDRPLLILHAPLDTVVGIENAGRLFEMARHPRSFVSLDGADHLLTDPGDSEWISRVLSAWASRYLAPLQGEAPEDLRDGERVRARIGAEGLRTEVAARGHRLVADEPASVGGTDRGPTPYELVAAGLGACTAMTLRMYADRKDWPLDGVDVRLRHRRIQSEDGGGCEAGPGASGLDILDREIRFEGGGLSDDQKDRLLEIADRCPVHRTLSEGVHVRARRPEPEIGGLEAGP